MVIFVAISAAGCATPHVITMEDGSTIETKDKPKLDTKSGFYSFETPAGQKKSVNKDKIRIIKKVN
jgi:hypothetical protein